MNQVELFHFNCDFCFGFCPGFDFCHCNHSCCSWDFGACDALDFPWASYSSVESLIGIERRMIEGGEETRNGIVSAGGTNHVFLQVYRDRTFLEETCENGYMTVVHGYFFGDRNSCLYERVVVSAKMPV